MSSLPGPHDTLRDVLPNGITLLARPNFASPSVVVAGFLTRGGRHDPPGKTGLAQFAALSLLRGSERSDFQTLSNRLESLGAALGFGAGINNTSFGGRCLAEDLPVLLGTLSEALREAIFPVQQVERLRSQILTSLAIRDQDTSERAEMALEELIFPDHPYGRPVEGWPQTVSAIGREDLLGFYRGYEPRGLVLAVVGGVDPQQVRALAGEILGGWEDAGREPDPPLPAVNGRAAAARRHIPLADKPQVDLALGCLGPSRRDTGYMAASLANHVLGQFGMAGRLGEIVREKAGLAYSIGSSLSGWTDAGTWEIGAGVSPEHLPKALALILDEVTRLREGGVTEEELEDSRANYIGRLPLSLESNSGVANALLQLERFDLGLDYFQRYPVMLEKITRGDLQMAAQRWLDPQRLHVVSAGGGVPA